MSKNVRSIARGKENKSSRVNQLNMVNQKERRHSIDTDSGISSVKRRSRDKVATSITTDDDEEVLSRKDSLTNGENRRASDASSITNYAITKTSSEFHLNSIASSHSSRLNMPISSLSMLAIGSQQSLTEPLINTDNNDGKSRSSFRNFFSKIFGSSSRNQTTTSTSIEPLNIGHVHGTAYPSMSPLPITQGPIRLFVLRHGERLDRYYSSQWLKQAFDKDGIFCRFSPILP